MEPITHSPPKDLVPSALEADDVARSLSHTALALRLAEGVAGAGLEWLRFREKRPHEGDPPLALACPPTVSGFAEVHARLAPVESSALRARVRAEKKMPALREARLAGLLTETAYRLLCVKATPFTVGGWVQFAEGTSPKRLLEFLHASKPGELPQDVDLEAGKVRCGPLPVDPESSGAPRRWKLDNTVLFAAEQHDIWARARDRACRETQKTLGNGEALAAMVEGLARRALSGAAPASLAEVTPPPRRFRDPLRGVEWVQTPEANIHVVPLEVTAPGARPPTVMILTARGETLSAEPEALLRAFPEFRWFPASSPDERRRDESSVSPGEGMSQAPEPPAEDGVPASALDRVDIEAAHVPASSDPIEVRAVAASAGRAIHVLRRRQAAILAELSDRVRRGEIPREILDWTARDAGLADRDVEELAALGRRLRSRPRLAEAFASARVSYTEARELSRAIRPDRESVWTAWAQGQPSFVVLSVLRSADPGDSPPRVPRGMRPTLPVGTKVPEGIHATLEGPLGAAMDPIAGELRRLGVDLGDPAALLAALAGWYLRVSQPDEPPRLFYLRSPESRVPGRSPREVLSPDLLACGSVEERLEKAFSWLGIPRRRLARVLPRPGGKKPGSRSVSQAEKWAVRARDGEKCATLFCGNTLTTQHDHGRARSRGGVSDVIYDHRLCGPCNRARHLGLLYVLPRPDGGVSCLDGEMRPLGSLAPVGRQLDGPLLDRLLDIAERRIGARLEETGSPLPFGPPPPAPWAEEAPRAVA
ncbi:MAG: hypothetical protein L0216_05450 [Planctomycetales bacterium]|nr:hypothetical protein [Planctomycetales bacterium]